jgi:NitT/TauT family transport system substrate-binding protein
MKILKLLLIVIVIVAIALFVKVKFFNPFEQDVTISSKPDENDSSKKLDKIVLAGPFATVSHPLIHIVKSGALSDVAKEVEFRLWRNPDQLRALVLEGSVHFVAVPTNVAANLYNKRQPIQLLNVSIWGILGMMTRDENLKTLADFKGKEIVVPFRSDMPDIVLKELIKAQGFDPDKDFKLTYVSNPIDAMQMLILRRVDHALLAEPAISMALRKTGSFPLKAIAPTLFRSADLQDEWAKTFNTDNKVPQAGIAVLGEIDKKIIDRFNVEYKKALNWYSNCP